MPGWGTVLNMAILLVYPNVAPSLPFLVNTFFKKQEQLSICDLTRKLQSYGCSLTLLCNSKLNGATVMRVGVFKWAKFKESGSIIDCKLAWFLLYITILYTLLTWHGNYDMQVFLLCRLGLPIDRGVAIVCWELYVHSFICVFITQSFVYHYAVLRNSKACSVNDRS